MDPPKKTSLLSVPLDVLHLLSAEYCISTSNCLFFASNIVVCHSNVAKKPYKPYLSTVRDANDVKPLHYNVHTRPWSVYKPRTGRIGQCTNHAPGLVFFSLYVRKQLFSPLLKLAGRAIYFGCW